MIAEALISEPLCLGYFKQLRRKVKLDFKAHTAIMWLSAVWKPDFLMSSLSFIFSNHTGMASYNNSYTFYALRPKPSQHF